MTHTPLLVRTATEADLPLVAAIHMASWHNAYKGVVPDAVLDGRTVAGSLTGWRATFAEYPANLTVAETAGGQIAGFCCAGPVVDAEKNAPFEFEIYGLHVLPDARRQGLGAALLRDTFRRARERERMHSVIVWTLEELRLSRKFYEREGGVLVKTGMWPVGGFSIPEVAYGWRLVHPQHRSS